MVVAGEIRELLPELWALDEVDGEPQRRVSGMATGLADHGAAHRNRSDHLGARVLRLLGSHHAAPLTAVRSCLISGMTATSSGGRFPGSRTRTLTVIDAVGRMKDEARLTPDDISEATAASRSLVKAGVVQTRREN